MTTTQTDALMALADRYAFHIPGSQHSDEARAVLLAALQAREGEAVAWHHGCNVLCADIDLWIDRCPHCGKPRPAAPAPQPAQPSEPAQPEQGEQVAFTEWWGSQPDDSPTYQATFAAGYRAALQSAQPVALPLTDEQIEKLRDKTFSINNPFCPVDSKSMRKAVRATESAHGIGGGR